MMLSKLISILKYLNECLIKASINVFFLNFELFKKRILEFFLFLIYNKMYKKFIKNNQIFVKN